MAPPNQQRNDVRTEIEITPKDIKTMQEMVADFDTGYMANHAASMDKRRLKYQRFIQSLLDRVGQPQKDPTL